MTREPARQLHIDPRFRGPPHSGNGGYVCGLVALHAPGPVAVRLLAPPPLGRDLRLDQSDGALRLLDGESPVAQARCIDPIDLEAPPAPTLEEAREASQSYAGFVGHPFPGCFVCGPERADGDGLRIFPGGLPGRELVAAPWTPAPDLADDHGRVLPEFIWSALDCTGFFAFGPLADGSPALLGELAARIDGTIRAGEPHVVAGWLIGAEGRKRFVGSALYRADGTPLAVARATWIVVPRGTAGAIV
jgi:hypothetical protein